MFKTLTGAGSTLIGHSLHRFQKPKELPSTEPARHLFSLEYVTLEAFNPTNPQNAIVEQEAIIKVSAQEIAQLEKESEGDVQKIKKVYKDLAETKSVHFIQGPVLTLSDVLNS